MTDVELAAVESFTLDHTKVLAPYVRLIGVERGPKGDAISNFDIRFVQPNEGEIPTAGLHTIEHTLAGLIRTRFEGLIDISPFGCRTGFHMIVWGEPTAADVAGAIKTSLEDLAERVTWADVPGTTAESCGNYRDHSLHSAKEWAKLILEQGLSIDAFDRSVIA
ncbi:MAG: S-ribosylhomocysteine lyase [Leucobacter sp.]